MTDAKTIAKIFSNLFVKIGPNLASKILKSDKNFEAYINEVNTKLQENPLTEDIFLEAFKSLKIKKAPGFDEIVVDVINQICNHIRKPLISIFDDSIKLRVFPEKLKLAKVTPSFKSGKSKLLMNYRQISVFLCFSKILEMIMYDRLYEHLTKNNLLFDKQLGFRKSHSTEHALIELVNRTYNSFNENKYILGVFIDLSKAFDKVNHNILLYKTEVLQGSILGPLLSINYIKDLYNVSNILQPIMFADGTNLFLSHGNTKDVFNNVNLGLNKIAAWFTASKLSLNEEKTKLTFSHKFCQEGNILFKLPMLEMNGKDIERTTLIKFLSICLMNIYHGKSTFQLLKTQFQTCWILT